MKRTLFAVPAIAALVLLSSSAIGQTAPTKNADGILVTATGMTLYTFDKDVGGSDKSNCNGPCAANWPPLPAASTTIAAPYSVVMRDDGARQLAYNGKPLYLYAADKKPGDRSGDNVKEVWHVVKD